MESHCPADLEGHFKQRTEWAALNRERLSFLSSDSSELSRMQKVLARHEDSDMPASRGGGRGARQAPTQHTGAGRKQGRVHQRGSN